MRYQIRDAQGRKVNVIIYDGVSELDLPEGFTVEPDDGSPLDVTDED